MFLYVNYSFQTIPIFYGRAFLVTTCCICVDHPRSSRQYSMQIITIINGVIVELSKLHLKLTATNQQKFKYVQKLLSFDEYINKGFPNTSLFIKNALSLCFMGTLTSYSNTSYLSVCHNVCKLSRRHVLIWNHKPYQTVQENMVIMRKHYLIVDNKDMTDMCKILEQFEISIKEIQ